MALIKSISGIRGTIGGKVGESLSPVDVVKFAAAYGSSIKKDSESRKIVIGRDARMSGDMVSRMVVGALQSVGLDVIDLGLSTTPTVEIAVVEEAAAGGIILTASHNPKHWNALKLLNAKGEFISKAAGQQIIEIAESEEFDFVSVTELGTYSEDDTYLAKHIEQILALPLVDVAAIKAKKFKVVVDGINSTGGIAVPMLLRALGVEDIIELHCEVNGNFAHNPEPLPAHLATVSNKVKREEADLAFVVDPDVDRLAIVCENGEMFGEEYSLVAISDYVLQYRKGSTVSNLSSTRALRDITEKADCQYFASAVGEVNVVAKMKEVDAVIGGEGNGGIIYPKLHFGRDALVGIALFLSHLAIFGKSCSLLRSQYPNYHLVKHKAELTVDMDVDAILEKIQHRYRNQPTNTIDGVRIEFDSDWVHLRKSNTEPIIRIYAESLSRSTAETMVKRIMADIKTFME